MGKGASSKKGLPLIVRNEKENEPALTRLSGNDLGKGWAKVSKKLSGH